MSGPPNHSISNLRDVRRYVTTHREDGKAIVRSTEPGAWESVLNNELAFNVIYTTSEFPSQMNGDADIKAHEKVAQAGTGLVNAGGSVCRIVDFAPGNDPLMHRTKSLDYGVVLEGEMEMILDSGEVSLLKRGDVAVQRGTMHAWKNPSATQWGRMLFVLLDAQPLQVGGADLAEELSGAHEHGIPPSNN